MIKSSIKNSISDSLSLPVQNLARGMDLLTEPQIRFGNEFGYEYKHWTPMWIPFIQYSTEVWTPDDNGLLPASVLIPTGQSKSFQILTPKDHPFLLIDVKISAAYYTEEEIERSVVVTNYSRFKTPFLLSAQPLAGGGNTQNYLWKKYLFPDVEGLSSTLSAVSPGGRPIWGSEVNTSGYVNGVQTVGAAPHLERIPVSSSQGYHSGRGSLRSYLLFPSDGMIRVEVENGAPSRGNFLAEGFQVNGMCFGYMIMR